MTPRVSPAIFGLSGTVLTADESAFFKDVAPAGFILFARNIDTPHGLRALTDQLRTLVGWDVPILIDQEGGRVQRMTAPHWHPLPAIGSYADWPLERRQRALWLHARIIGDDLAQVGINVNCLPLLDVPAADGDAIIGDRAFGTEPDTIIEGAKIVIAAMAEAGVQPVIKHVPGHGRATADSHLELPVVTASRDVLEAVDFVPFKALSDAPFAMTAHIDYTALDKGVPATFSSIVVGEIMRRALGLTGLIMTDDLSMKALGGSYADRATRSLDAGCDLLLHCNGMMAEMQSVIDGVGARYLDRSALETCIRPLIVAEQDAQQAWNSELAALIEKRTA